MTIKISVKDYNELCKIWHIKVTPQQVNESHISVPKGFFRLTSESQNPNIQYINIPCRAYRSYTNAVLYYLSSVGLVNTDHKLSNNLTRLVNPNALFDDSILAQVEKLANDAGQAYQKPTTVEENRVFYKESLC